MTSVILIIHLLLALAIIGLVLLQRSEGGGLGIGGGGGGGLGNLATAKGTANALTRATAICAAAFFTTSIVLGVLAGQQSSNDILETITDTPQDVITAPVDTTDIPADNDQNIPSAPIAE